MRIGWFVWVMWEVALVPCRILERDERSVWVCTFVVSLFLLPRDEGELLLTLLGDQMITIQTAESKMLEQESSTVNKTPVIVT